MPLYPTDLGTLLDLAGPSQITGTYQYKTLEIGMVSRVNLTASVEFDGASAIDDLEIGMEISSDNVKWSEPLRLVRADLGADDTSQKMTKAAGNKTYRFYTEQARGSLYARIRYRANGAGAVKAGDKLKVSGDWW